MNGDIHWSALEVPGKQLCCSAVPGAQDSFIPVQLAWSSPPSGLLNSGVRDFIVPLLGWSLQWCPVAV